MKLKTKKIIFYSLVGSTILLTGAGLGSLFGWAKVHDGNTQQIMQDNNRHTGLVVGSILTGFAAASALVLVEFGLSYYFTIKFIKTKKEKLKKQAISSNGLNKKPDPLVLKDPYSTNIKSTPTTNFDKK